MPETALHSDYRQPRAGPHLHDHPALRGVRGHRPGASLLRGRGADLAPAPGPVAGLFAGATAPGSPGSCAARGSASARRHPRDDRPLRRRRRPRLAAPGHARKMPRPGRSAQQAEARHRRHDRRARALHRHGRGRPSPSPTDRHQEERTTCPATPPPSPTRAMCSRRCSASSAIRTCPASRMRRPT